MEEVSKNSAKSNGKKTAIVTGIVIAAVIAISIIGYGLFNGFQIKNYANSITAIINESASNWTDQDITSSLSLDDLIKKLAIVQSDSETQLKKLDALNAPAADKNLESKTREYFNLSKTVSTKILALADYIKALQAANTNLGNVGGSASTAADFVTIYTDFHQRLAQSITALKAASPDDEAYKQFNTQYVANLENFDAIIVKAIGYAQNGQMEQIAGLTAEFDAVSQAMASLTPPNDTEALNKIISTANQTKLNSLPVQIKTEAAQLSTTVFSF